MTPCAFGNFGAVDPRLHGGRILRPATMLCNRIEWLTGIRVTIHKPKEDLDGFASENLPIRSVAAVPPDRSEIPFDGDRCIQK